MPAGNVIARIALAASLVALAACAGPDVEAYERIHAALKPQGAVERTPCGKGYSAMTCSYIAPGSLYELRETTLEKLLELHFGGWGGNDLHESVVAWSMDGKTKLVYTAKKSGRPAWAKSETLEWAEVTISIQSDDYHRCAIDCVPRD